MSGAMKMSEGLQASTSGEMGTSEMETEEYYNPEGGEEWSQKVDTGQLCRVCANPNEYLIPIFDGEGLEHELSVKIEKHLPIKVTDTDTLPRHMCYQCASTLIAWHDLVNCCIEADKKLRELQAEEEEIEDDFDKGAEMFEPHSVDDSEAADEVDQPSTSEVQKQESRVPSPKKTAPSKRPKLTMVLVKGNSAGSSGLKTAAAAKSPVAKSPELAKSKDGANQDTSAERSPDVEQDAPTVLQAIGNSEILPSFQKSEPEQVYSIWIKADNDSREYYLCDVKELESRAQEKESAEMIPTEEIKEQSNSESWISQLADHDYVQTSPTTNQVRFVNQVTENLSRVPHSYMMKCVKVGDRCQAKLVTSNQPVQCNYCLKAFSSEAVALTHLRTHTGFSPFYCKYCASSFKLSSSLKQHMANCTCNADGEIESKISHPLTKGNDEKYACTICGKMYKRKPSLKEHMRSHFGLARRKQKCEVCGEKFLTKAEIKEHMQTHDSHSFFQCRVCKKDFINERDLADHMISHSAARPYSCSLCGATYKRKSHLNRHALTHQGNPKLHILQRVRKKAVFKCRYCGKEKPSPRLLMIHEVSHTGERNYECYVCRKRFAQSGALSRHIRVVHEGAKDFTCEICHQSFTAKATKDNHMRIHTGEKPFQCDTCGKTFRTQQQHRIHERVHSDVRPYPCPYCPKSFRRRPHLIVHIRTHTGEKPYACPVCGRCFAQKNDMNKHMNIHNRVKREVRDGRYL